LPTAGQRTRGLLVGKLLDEARHLQYARVEVARVEVVGPQPPDHLVYLAQFGDREGLLKKRKRQARGLDELANPRHGVAEYLRVVESQLGGSSANVVRGLKAWDRALVNLSNVLIELEVL